MAKATLFNPSGYSPKQQRNLRRRGFSIRGYIPGAPDAAQPRTQKWLRSQAVKTIGLAYRPAQRAMNDRQRRVEALQAKRGRDHEAYQAWLAQQQTLLRSEADTRNAQLQAQVQQHQIETRDSMLQVTQQANTRTAAANVSGTVDAGGVVSGAQRAAIEQGAARATALTEGQGRSTDLLAATQANNLLAAKALEAKDFAKSLDELRNVADAKTSMQLQKGSDTAKAISHLLDVEVNKAQQNAQLQLAGQRLGVQMAGIRQRDRANRRQQATTRRGQNLTFQAASNRIMQQQNALAETHRHNRAQEKAARDKLKLTDPKGASKTERAQQTQAIRSVNRMKSYMNDMLGPGKRNADGDIEKFRKVVKELRNQYPNDIDLLLIAYDLWRFGRLRGEAKKRWKGEYGYNVPKGW